MSTSRRPTPALNLFRPCNGQRQLPGWRRILEFTLRRLGPTWQAAPVRRTIQTVCFLLYLYLFFYVSWPYAALFSSRVLESKEWLPVETFLWIDPLVGLSTALAARWWNVGLIGMAAILAVGLIFPRGFCGYLCPLGTLIDVFDFVTGRVARALRPAGAGDFPVARSLSAGLESPANPQARKPALRLGVWSNLRFHLLAAVLAAALCGVLLSGFVAAIPVLTRGLLFSAGNLQLGLAKNWGMVPPITPAVWVSLALFAVVLLLSLLGPRFWCRYVCPSGALLSLPSLLRRFKRQVDDHCIACGKCLEVCPFDAIQPDFGTRTLNCTFCQTCGGVCPTQAIHFVSLATTASCPKPDALTGQPLTRRGMLASLASGAAAAVATRLAPSSQARPIRPPGSVAEERFLDLCIRCEQCLKVCPGPVLQAAGLEHGFEALWTPVAVFPHAGCHQDCHFCTQVCPTGAIAPLTPTEKRRFVMGLAIVNAKTCLPHRGERDCQLCFDECNAAGYRAIEMRPIKLATGDIPDGTFSPDEIEQMGRILAPFVKADACVGCGLCEYRCHAVFVGQRRLLQRSAIVVMAPQQKGTPAPGSSRPVA